MVTIDSKQNLITLIKQYQNLVFSICLKLTGDYFAAEDLTQETFLAAYKHLEQCPTDAQKSWLCRIASNKCIDYSRSAARRLVPIEGEEIHSTELIAKEEPLRQVLNQEVMEELRSCCGLLPPPYKDTARLYFLENKTAKEIAQLSQTSPNTVKTHIHRAREMLKKIYRKELLQE